MDDLPRREFLRLVPASAAAFALRGRSAPDAAELATRFRQVPRAEAFDLASKAIREGVPLETFLGAVLLAGVHDVRPRIVGGKLHSVLVVESMFQLAAAATPAAAWQLALWNLEDFKRSQDLDRDEGDWTLPPAPAVARADAAETRAALADAMERWDDEAADRAITALVRLVDHDAAFEAMWPLAARSYVNIGHKIIFAAQVERALRRLGWRYAEPVMRSLANGLLYAPGDRETAAFDRSIALASEFPEGWLSKVEDPPRSAEIPKAIRRADPPAAQRAVLASLRDGVGPATAWDGLRLFASELFARRTRSRPADDRRALLPVHAVTVTEAFGYAARTTKVERTQRLLLLQAAAWLAQLRVDLDRIVGLEDEAPKPAPAVADADTLRRAWPGLLARKGVEHHQHKYLAAVIAESRVVHPRWESQILSAALPYAPTADDADTETFARAEHALRAAGIRDG